MQHRILVSIRHNAIALLALFIALGGASYAAVKIPAHSVGTKQLRTGAVTSKKLARHSVSASKLDPKSIAGHIAEWARISPQGQVIASSPQASVIAKAPAVFQVSWQRALPSDCIATANPTDVGIEPASATTMGPNSSAGFSDVLVATFDRSGANVPEAVNVVIICP